VAIYRAYAPFYDASGQIRFTILIAQYLREILQRHPVTGRNALDLACGTGTLAVALADDGWHVLGVDQSPAMLAIARAKAALADEPARLTFVEGDMRAPPVPNAQFDLATCTYDSLNYLLDPGELSTCFVAAARALRPGGIFFGDMNTRYFLAYEWGECVITENPGYVQIARSSFDAATDCSTMRLTGFAGDDAAGYRRFDEQHIERAYDPETILACLGSAGFAVEGVYDCFTFEAPYEQSQRLAIVARRV
jgi:ubiquinone/menaquinone biosynthesis C-methylase UbiE